MESPEDKKVNIERIALNKDDELLFRIKYGYASPFRLKAIAKDDGPNEYSNNKYYMTYIITNIPNEDNDD